MKNYLVLLALVTVSEASTVTIDSSVDEQFWWINKDDQRESWLRNFLRKIRGKKDKKPSKKEMVKKQREAQEAEESDSCDKPVKKLRKALIKDAEYEQAKMHPPVFVNRWKRFGVSDEQAKENQARGLVGKSTQEVQDAQFLDKTRRFEMPLNYKEDPSDESESEVLKYQKGASEDKALVKHIKQPASDKQEATEPQKAEITNIDPSASKAISVVDAIKDTQQ